MTSKILFRLLISTVSIVSTLSLGSCRHKGAAPIEGGDTITSQAQLLTLVDLGDYVVADVRNPWGDGLLDRYILAPRDYSGELPEGTVIKVPLQSSVVYSGVYAGAIDELGAVGAITGVADAQYFGTPSVVSRIASGRIADIGNTMSPSVERVVDLDPDAIILSPYQDMEPGAVAKLGIPIVQFVDYMEATPLGRAEWIRLLGILYGNSSAADSIFSKVSADYAALTATAASAQNRPVVLTEQPLSGGSWDIPAGGSYMARLLNDAGANYPWSNTTGTGSLKFDAPAVIDKAADADFWIIRNFGPLSRQALGAGNPLNSHFKAFRTGNIYVCDTSSSPLFDEFPFHPERLLRDYIAIFHPELLPAHKLRYFSRIK